MIKTFTVHAGTHKTASTYIQSRLWRNREILQEHGVKLLYPRQEKTGQYVDFARWVNNENYTKIEEELAPITDDHNHLLVSAEQFTKSFLSKEHLDGFQELLAKLGYKLNIVIFLRDQPDYINSIYVQEVRRFYHSLSVPTFEINCRKQRSHRFNYEEMFSHLLDDNRINVKFLPYCSSFGDPFGRLIDSLEQDLPQDIEWIPANPGKSNDQPGVKGVWLALKACKRMQKLGVKLQRLENQSNYIRKYSIPRRWSEDRFYGLRPKKVKIIREYYKSGNDRFARRVWDNKTWEEVYKNLPMQKYNVMDEELLSKEEMNERNELLEQILSDLKQGNPSAFSKARKRRRQYDPRK